MQVSSVNFPVVNTRTGYNQQIKKQPINFSGGLSLRRNASSAKLFEINLSRDELINYVKYYFKPGVVERLNVNNNIERNSMLLLFAEKFATEIKDKGADINRQFHLFEQASRIVNTRNKAQKLILKDNHYSTDDFINISKHLDKRYNVDLTTKLLDLKDENNCAIDFSKMLVNILEMPKAKNLDKDFQKYKSYIVLNFRKENFLESLEKELNQNGQNIPYEKLDKIVGIRKKQAVSAVLSKIPEEILLKGNSDAIELLTESYTAQVFNQYTELPEEGSKFLEYFITTSNSGNFDTREKFLKNNVSHARENQSFSAIQLLFEKIDSDKNIHKIIDKFLNNTQLKSNVDIRKLLFYVDKFGAEQLAENADNFVNILVLSRVNTPDEIVKIIEHNLKNKYYTTLDEIKAQEHTEKYQGIFARLKGKLKRSIKEILEAISGPFPKVEPLNDVKFEDFQIVEKAVKAPIPVDLNQSNQVVNIVKLPSAKKVVREYQSENPKISARKLKIFNEGQEIIKTRMKSAAQIQEQARDYSLTATKMRNKYLNELFNYVSDVRKAENKAKIKKHSVSNYDVLELYQKINGYNEKEFRRMLRAKNENGERMYSFEEINKMLDDSIVEHYRLLREKQALRRKKIIEQPAIA